MEADISMTALQAARAYEEGDCRTVRRLYSELISSGVPAKQVQQAFREQGAGLELLPRGADRSFGMLSEVMG